MRWTKGKPASQAPFNEVVLGAFDPTRDGKWWRATRKGERAAEAWHRRKAAPPS